MKRVLIIILMILFLQGCLNNENIKETETKTDKLTLVANLDETINGFQIKGNYEAFSLKDVSEIGLVYLYANNYAESVDLKLDTENRQTVFSFDKKKEVKLSISDVDISKYENRVLARAYIKYKEKGVNYIAYSKLVIDTNIVELAYADNKTNFALSIIANYENIPNEAILEFINLLVDMQKYLVISIDERFVAAVDTDLKIVKITITLNAEYEFSNNFDLYINDILISSDDYEKTDTTITYEFDDPNWSGIF